MGVPDADQKAQATAEVAILARTRRRIELFENAGDDWRFAESLKSISEDTAQEYEGRAVLELVQNGHDALREDESGKIAVLIDLRGEPGVLYVANEGATFTERNFKSITEFALSDKGAGEGIGNKGLGFRSVLQLTDWPEIYSKTDPSSTTFDGYCFRFATPQDVRVLVGDDGDDELVARVIEQVSPLALPVPAVAEDPVLTEFAEAGFATVVRLPLRNAVAAAAALSQAKALVASEAPLLLFLDRVAALTVEIRDNEGAPERHLLTRSTGLPALVTAVEDEWVTEVDLASAGRYLLARRVLDIDELNAAIDQSIEAREIDEKWRNWKSEASVAVALRLDAEMERGQLYTFLPMSGEARSPLCAHAHAPFFTKLARLDISETIALNDYLLRQLAALSVDLSRRLRAEAPHDIAAGLVLDLVCWDPPDRLNAAFGGQLASEPVVPLAGEGRWGSLDESYCWPARARQWGALTPHALAHVGADLLDPSVGLHRRSRTTALHTALLNTSMHPPDEVAASWVERVAMRLRPENGDPVPPVWGEFYDDVEHAFRGNPDAMRGRKIILDQDGELRAALGATADPGQREETIFFSPGADGGDDGAARVPKDLRVLRRRINFTHPDIPWRQQARSFLETHQLVREYRADRVFDALKDLLAKTSSNPLRRDALVFAFRQFASLTQAQRNNLHRVGFFVPKADGSWARATECLLSPGWKAGGAQRLERFLDAGGATIPPMAALRERWIKAPEDWPTKIAETDTYRDFLHSIGVRDGLMLFNLGSRLGERDGGALMPRVLGRQFHLDDRLAEAWAADVETTWRGGSHPWTKYAFDRPLVHLPDAAGVCALSTPARRQFAELIILGLRSWGDYVFSVTVRRPNRTYSQQDPHAWPTPFASYLRHMPWLPIQDSESEDVTFVTPSQAWFNADGELPTFVPSIPLPVRRLLTNDKALAHLRQAGLRIWGEPRHASAAVKDLGSILAAGAVPDHHSISFKKHYATVWGYAAGLSDWPWSPDEPVRLAVVCGSGLTAITPSPEQQVYVCDETAPLKESLVELAGHPVLVTGPEAGERVAQMLEAHSIGVARLSMTQVEVRDGEEEPITPSADNPLLAEDRDWLVTVVALVLELKSGAFLRRSERGVRTLLDRLRTIRVVRPHDVRILIAGQRADPPPTTRSLPLPDPDNPTIVLLDSHGTWDEVQACAPALSQLLGQPSLQDALELAFVKLQRILDDRPPDHIDDQTLAHALDIPETRIAELRRSLTGELSDLIRLLRPVLVCAAGVGNVNEIDEAMTRAGSEEILLETIKAWQGQLPQSASEILALTRSRTSLAELRDALGFEFGSFNAALSALGSPYAPIVHPDIHDQVFDDFIQERSVVILNRLREHYSPFATAGDDVTEYARARRFEGLEPNPAWLPEFAAPPAEQMQARIGLWLRQHGADDDLERTTNLEPVDEIRTWNASRLDHLVPQLVPVVSAWCRQHGGVVPAAWAGTPLLDAKSALDASGLSDLLRLDERRLLRAVAQSVGWPAGMPITTDLDALKLKADDLIVPSEPTADGGGSSGRQRPTITLGDTAIIVGTDRLAEIAERAYQTIDEAFLSQSGTVKLDDLTHGGGPRRQGSHSSTTVVARMARMSEDQRAAIGLIGEVVARAWLLRRHSEVRWRSGYAAMLNADTHASDSYGYDFEIPWRNTSLLYEVKALSEPPGELIEFEMGESEVRAAQECANGNRYRILLVTSALDPLNRKLYELPSPFSSKGRGRFRVAGRGLRYQCGPLRTE